MPYIEQKYRAEIDPCIENLTKTLALENPSAGDINYIFTKILLWWYEMGPSYTRANAVEGICGSVAKEFYRRVTAPYEDQKAKENGDVF